MDPQNELLLILLMFSIPALAILRGWVMGWLKMRSEHKSLSAFNQELEQKVAHLERANADQGRRLENLETIVVSQTWSVLHTPGAAGAERPQRAAVAPHEVQTPAAEEMNRQRAEQLARRLGG